MTKVLNTFTKGIMFKDLDMSLTPQDAYRHAENIRFNVNNGNDRIGNNIKGSVEVSNSIDGNFDYKCICAFFDRNTDKIYYWLATTNGMFSKIVEYNTKTGVTEDVIKDGKGILNFNKKSYITGVNEINGLLIFSEWGNNIRKINIERAKTYGINNFSEEDISLIVKPPINPIKIQLQRTTSLSGEENNIEKKFISFSYRYRYLDGQYSALAQFTNFAFRPKQFDYDFSIQSNLSMINSFNQVLLKFNTGSKLVTEIQLVFKQSETLETFIIDDFDKKLLGWGDNEEREFLFDNLKTIRGLPKESFDNYFDNVPRTAKAQSLIDGRLIIGHYKENYDIKDSFGNKINIDYYLSLDSKEVDIGIPQETAKSVRDYEVVICYLDEWLRTTTALKSKTNTIFIPNNLSSFKNTIQVNLKNKPPEFAKYFRFFIRQNGKGYEQIIPTTFYEDGFFRWVKLENSEKDKIKEGDYLIIKSDSQGNQDIKTRTKVLAVEYKDVNFLEENSTTSIKQLSGLYFKIKPIDFRLDEEDFERYRYTTFDSNSTWEDPIINSVNQIEDPHFYGNGNLDDLESLGNFQGFKDTRYLIEIDSIGDGDTTFNTFRWSKDGGESYEEENIEITPEEEQEIEFGLKIKFQNNIGHSLYDIWYISAKSNEESIGYDEDGWAYPMIRGNGVIEGGARIQIIYSEYGDEKQYVKRNYISSRRYANIEEWWYQDKIGEDFPIPSSRYWFRRGEAVDRYVLFGQQITGRSRLRMSTDRTGNMCLVFRSKGYENSNFDKTAKVKTDFLIIQSEQNIIFETEPKDTIKDIFYEIPTTYKIEDGFHKGSIDNELDIDQSSQNDLKVNLNFFNAFTFGNAIESYKIFDEFNQKGLDTGIRTISNTKEEYKEVIRESDATWSDVYNDDSNFNGLSTFNLSLLNFIVLDKENGSIQKLHNSNGNLMVLQEEGIGLIPYNKNIIYDAQGGNVVGISTNILNKESYRPYQSGKVGISKNPESFVADGSRVYFTDKQRGNFIRISNNGVTEINQYEFEHKFSDLMVENINNPLISGFDPKHKEILLNIPSKKSCLVFKEKSLGFPQYMTFQPDFMLNANNEFYCWKNGIMYRMNATENRNNFFGQQKESKVVFSVNHSFAVEKFFRALGLYSTHSWLAKLKTRLTSREIPKECFVKKEDIWYSEIMGNTNNNKLSNSVFGIGSYEIINGEIDTILLPSSISVGDFVSSKTLDFSLTQIKSIKGKKIILDSNITTVKSFLQYSKNQNIDGGDIRGDYMEVELINGDSEKVEIRAVSTELSKSFYS